MIELSEINLGEFTDLDLRTELDRTVITPCPSSESCELVQELLDKPIEDLEREEKVQLYGLDYNILDLLCMRDNAWEDLRKLI